MITAVRPYTAQNNQRQNFKSKIPKEFLQGCREGDCEYMNRIMEGFPHSYTVAENKEAIKKVIEDPKTKMSPSLKDLADLFGIKL